jgi:hypothetical protein
MGQAQAQSSGPGGRRFESSLPDHSHQQINVICPLVRTRIGERRPCSACNAVERKQRQSGKRAERSINLIESAAAKC